MLRWVFKHQDSVQMALGNHDLSLLAVSEGYGKVSSSDTFMDIIQASDGKLLLGLAALPAADAGRRGLL